MRASGVFTGTTNSPSRSPRQSFDRYAIRAGRNLPDKEFRYLRTVIVTVSLTLFPEKPDFLLRFLCSLARSYRSDFFDALQIQVFSLTHQVKDLSEPREVDPLLRFQRMLFEEGNNPFGEVIQPPDSISHPVAVIRSNHSTAEEFLQCVEQLNIPAVLDDREFGEHLKLGRTSRDAD